MRKLALLLGLAFCFANAETAQEAFCGSESLSKCISHYQEQCNDKNYATCLIVGDLRITMDEYRNATKYLEMACENANIKATYQINQIDGSIEKMSGIFITQSSCKLLGHIYYKKEDFKRTKEIFTKSCEKLEGNSCDMLAEMYTNGKGVKQDLSKAKELYGKACDLGQEINGCFMYKLFNEMNIK